jgi:hypothetical protein
MKIYIYCQLKSKQDINAHELLLYDAFVNRAKHGWIYHHYKHFNNRMRAPFPYKDQLIYGIKDNNRLWASVAINLNTRNPMQLELMGFTRDLIDTSYRFAEVLSLCATGEKVPLNALDIIKGFNAYLIEKFKEHTLQDIYGVTLKKKNRFYRRMGFKTIDEIKKTYGSVFLLRHRIL